MRPEQIKKEISQLELSEKLILVEDIWDSIAATNSDIPMADWQKLELDARYEAFKQGSLGLQSWQEVHEELREKYK
ncbi:MAG: addiction module protein [Gammaproteobacteria bacterium]|nr:addiction module protein [Gammaproteobacteria bacterium]